MTTARLLTIERVDSHQTTYLDEVCQTKRLLQLVVERTCLAGYINIAPELFFDGINLLDSRLKTLCRTTHTNEIPHDKTQLLVNGIDRTLALNRHQLLYLVLNLLLCLSELRQVG